MNNKKVLITGAGTGIGLECTRQFLESGWMVAAHYHRTMDELKRLKKKFPIELFKADFTKSSDIQKFIRAIAKEPFHALVNNAAIYDFVSNTKTRISSTEDVLRANMIAPALIAEAVFSGMKARRQGHIINISSIGAKYGSNGKHKFYGISKRGLEALTHTLAREGAPFNICVNTIRPGVIDTPFHKKIKRNMEQRKAMIPMKRLGQPEEVADLIYYLCERQTFLTNQTITIAGGE